MRRDNLRNTQSVSIYGMKTWLETSSVNIVILLGKQTCSIDQLRQNVIADTHKRRSANSDIR